MHVLLTHEDGLGPPALGATRDMLILTGMSVLTMAVAPPSDLQAGSRFTLQSADPDCHPVYGVSAPVGEALQLAVQQGLQAQLCLVLSQETGEPHRPASADLALATAQLGMPVLHVRYPVHGAEAPVAWIGDLATEVAALLLTRPPPMATLLVLSVPDRLRARGPLLMPVLTTRQEPGAGPPIPAQVRQRAQEKDALAQGQATLTPVPLCSTTPAEAADLALWTQALAHTLHSRWAGPAMRCACCEPSLLPSVSHSH